MIYLIKGNRSDTGSVIVYYTVGVVLSVTAVRLIVSDWCTTMQVFSVVT